VLTKFGLETYTALKAEWLNSSAELYKLIQGEKENEFN